MILGYNDDLKRYGVLDFDLWVKGKEGLNCGQSLEVFINGEWVKDRIERKNDGTWYLVNNNQICGTGDYRDSIEGLKVRFN
ncbi:DUF5348 domain-containing protein [Clostridium botulinum]|uniref:DUF5348 domain-containing protein n=1 Tax=Clostridium botulinum TaxID=1491 RepID=A0A0M1M378_CLOBO|nr:DUF5348 domain-containing protein [Clostridium botulinum]KOR64115.1 hypothetical protein ADT22_01740 [Clostridium botulinum]MCS6112557.1 hypothetical protein [Clostridium botulinum]NFF88704.1 hypothetical protein [Clostridium botulinum]NFG11222.1 hypothetical protein [Clostridium botulinum]NFL43414.1 hypothetical protein [Clostridium botulinum]